MEAELRGKVLRLGDRLRAAGLPVGETARALGLRPRTLRHWAARERSEGGAVRGRGRPRQRSGVAARQAVLAFLDSHGPQMSHRKLARLHPELARRELEWIQARYRSLWLLRHPEVGWELEWPTPGAVWAADHVFAPRPVGERGQAILSARDLGAGRALLWRAVGDLGAEGVAEALEELFEERGAPLVIKLDGGAGFLAELSERVLRAAGVWVLYSPPRRPSYNGAVEAAGRWLKQATESIAARAGRAGRWEVEDLDAALEYSRLRSDPKRAAPPHGISAAERRAFARTVERHRGVVCAELGLVGPPPRRSLEGRCVDRIAITRALVEHGHLVIRRRRVSQPIKTARTA